MARANLSASRRPTLRTADSVYCITCLQVRQVTCWLTIMETGSTPTCYGATGRDISPTTITWPLTWHSHLTRYNTDNAASSCLIDNLIIHNLVALLLWSCVYYWKFWKDEATKPFKRKSVFFCVFFPVITPEIAPRELLHECLITMASLIFSVCHFNFWPHLCLPNCL
jgi:hypothetical protein